MSRLPLASVLCAEVPIARDRLDAAVARHASSRSRLKRFWAYYRNEPVDAPRADDHDAASRRPYRQAQEWGLPARLTGRLPDEFSDGRLDIRRKEIVIENDIGWRIDAGVDFLLGKPLVLNSASPERRDEIEALLRSILSCNGGLPMLQRLALLGAVYGHVDVIVSLLAPGAGDGELALRIHLEVVDPTRGFWLTGESGPAFVRLDARPSEDVVDTIPARPGTWLDKLLKSIRASHPSQSRRSETPVPMSVFTATHRASRDVGGRTTAAEHAAGVVPVVRVFNSTLPEDDDGGSDVEPLMPLQDELNTRLSDRASRIALQSFKMYLARGLEAAASLPVGPGQLWTTDNENAAIQEIGGDAGCPSEDLHIAEVREALDKTSGVSPIAAGAIKDRIGRLTSAAALRVTLMSLLSRTERKRVAYGGAIERLCEMSLRLLDAAGLFATSPAQRRIELNWPSPIPVNQAEQLELAKQKLDVGVPREQVLRELGYSTTA